MILIKDNEENVFELDDTNFDRLQTQTWNTIVIVLRGNKIKLELNNKVILNDFY